MTDPMLNAGVELGTITASVTLGEKDTKDTSFTFTAPGEPLPSI